MKTTLAPRKLTLLGGTGTLGPIMCLHSSKDPCHTVFAGGNNGLVIRRPFQLGNPALVGFHLSHF